MKFLGIDTSNYTTSAALYDTESGRLVTAGKLLPVRKGEAGLRQSDAVFHHTKQLPEVMERVFSEMNGIPDGIGVSVRPRNVEGSYMPCFLCGEGLADSVSAVCGIPVYKTSHQVGHILAALYSAGMLELAEKRFIAFHVSGGTTDCLLCEPDKENILKISEAGTSLDLKAGQAVDRVGLMLGLDFPCGKQLEALAAESGERFSVKPVIRDGNCCLSGLENKCRTMLDKGASREDTALYCLEYIYMTVKEMTAYALKTYGQLPVVFAGGVMSDRIIRNKLEKDFSAYFAEPEFSCDNAAGTAVFAALKGSA